MGSDHCQSLLQSIQNILMLPEPLFQNVSPVNPGIVILEYVGAIREEKKLMDDEYFWPGSVVPRKCREVEV